MPTEISDCHFSYSHDPGQRVVIIANGVPPERATVQRWLTPGARLICADGGARAALALGLSPHSVVGDFDSLDETQRARLQECGGRLIVYPQDKDWTDLELALKLAAEEGAAEVVILGALGGRIDQQLANILLLLLPELRGIPTWIVDETQEISVVRDRIEIVGQPGEVVSLIPLGGDVHGIVTEGLQYPLRDETLTVGPARGISNVMMGQMARVTLRAGCLLIIHAATSS